MQKIYTLNQLTHGAFSKKAEFGKLKFEMVDGQPYFCFDDILKSLKIVLKTRWEKKKIIRGLAKKEDGLYQIPLESLRELIRKSNLKPQEKLSLDTTLTNAFYLMPILEKHQRNRTRKENEQ